MLGATGSIGRATVRAMLKRGHDVVCFVRPTARIDGCASTAAVMRAFEGADVRFGDVTDRESLRRHGFRSERFDTLVSCLASRTGVPRDAWAVDYQAHITALGAANDAGIRNVVLLSAICVQKPMLEFQHAKLAFERALIGSGTRYSIVRPTAFFKSLSGQIERVRQGKPFLVFGDGTATACKPISDGDLGDYVAACIDDEARQNQILPIGGPGDAITPRQQGEFLFKELGREPRFLSVPVGLLDAIVWGLSTVGRFNQSVADKAELARIGRYYATQSMLVWDHVNHRYDAAATPSTGSETLFDYYRRVIHGQAIVERGDHAVF